MLFWQAVSRDKQPTREEVQAIDRTVLEEAEEGPQVRSVRVLWTCPIALRQLQEHQKASVRSSLAGRIAETAELSGAETPEFHPRP